MPFPFEPLPLRLAEAALAKKKKPAAATTAAPGTAAPADHPFWNFVNAHAPQGPISIPNPNVDGDVDDETDETGAVMPITRRPILRRHPHTNALMVQDADNPANWAEVDDTGLDLYSGDDTGADDDEGICGELDDIGAECDQAGADLEGGDDTGAIGQYAATTVEEADRKIEKARAHAGRVRNQRVKARILAGIRKLESKKRSLEGKSRSVKRQQAYGPGHSARGPGQIANHRRMSNRQAASIARAQAQNGARFDVSGAPPGSGRQVEVGMYLTGAATPQNIGVIPSSPFAVAAVTSYTEDVPYEAWIVTGLKTFVQKTSGSLACAYVSNFETKGSANLLVNDQATNAEKYADPKNIIGLRQYVWVTSPNVVKLDTQFLGETNSVGDSVNAEAYALGTIIWDDVFGPGAPGPTEG